MKTKEMRRLRRCLALFIALLVLSGLTAFPLRSELRFLHQHSAWLPVFLQNWVAEVDAALQQTPELVLYGTDWLAFAHLVIALFFLPVYHHPQRYIQNLKMGLVACVGIVPLALICGQLRGIPVYHQWIDCSFGILGALPLLYVQRQIRARHLHRKSPISFNATQHQQA